MSYPEALTPRRAFWPEFFRILFLVAAAIGVTSPFLTSHTVGGVDARWYAFMMRGFTDQIGGGHFPLPVGEGPFAWNGGVHPFRSAPIFLLLGGVWKILALGSLGTFTLVHAVLVTCAVAGTLGFYAASSKLMPANHWRAAGVSLLYLCAPSWLAVVFKWDAYMSYVAFAAMPLALYGNALTVMKPDGRGFLILGAGLALIWMCHPPIAFLTTMATLVVQTGRAVAHGFASWKKMLAGAALFGVLAAYYFVSMSELPPFRQGYSMPREVLQVAGLSLFFIGLGRSGLRPFRSLWPVVAVGAAVLVGCFNVPWIYWMGYSAAFWIAVVVASRSAARIDMGRHAVCLLFACAIAGAAAAEGTLGFADQRHYRAPLLLLAQNTSVAWALIRPLSAPLGGVPMTQSGWALDIAFVAGFIALFGRRPVGAKIFFATAVGLVICFIRVPLASNFIVGYFPIGLASMCGLPLGLRIMPVIAGFIAMGGVLWLASVPSSHVTTRRLSSGVLALAVAWSAWQSGVFIRDGHTITGDDRIKERDLRSEDVILERFAYDLMLLPDYYSNGVTDPAMESRLVDDLGNVTVGPDESAEALEHLDSRRIHLVCEPIAGAPAWFGLSPKLTLAPGEHVLLRFEFNSARNYNGWLMLISDHCYREYHLPASGQSAAFGTGPTNSKVISIWNSGKIPEIYSLLMSREDGNDLDQNGGAFGEMVLSKWNPAALPVRLTSIDPYRATVHSVSGASLETFRSYLPGYRAYIDGKEVPSFRSRQALVEVRVPPGEHDVELRFVGTPRLWIAACVSAAGWLVFVALSVFGRRQAEEVGHA
jgi:hypothetical protein